MGKLNTLHGKVEPIIKTFMILFSLGILISGCTGVQHSLDYTVAGENAEALFRVIKVIEGEYNTIQTKNRLIKEFQEVQNFAADSSRTAVPSEILAYLRNHYDIAGDFPQEMDVVLKLPRTSYTLNDILSDRRGTCFELSLVTLLILEHFQIEVKMFISGNHAFIRYKENGEWRNVETTDHFKEVSNEYYTNSPISYVILSRCKEDYLNDSPLFRDPQFVSRVYAYRQLDITTVIDERKLHIVDSIINEYNLPELSAHYLLHKIALKKGKDFYDDIEIALKYDELLHGLVSYVLSSHYYALNDYNNAVKYAQLTQKYERYYINSVLIEGMALYELKQNKEALNKLEIVLGRNEIVPPSKLIVVLEVVAKIYMNGNRVDKALKYLYQGYKLDSNNDSLINLIALLLVEDNDFEEADTFINANIKKKVLNEDTIVRLHYLSGVVALQKKDSLKGITEFIKVLQLSRDIASPTEIAKQYIEESKQVLEFEDSEFVFLVVKRLVASNQREKALEILKDYRELVGKNKKLIQYENNIFGNE